MKSIKLILICSLTLWFYCCNNRSNKTNTQETIAENIEIDASDQNIENSSSELTKVYTMKKKDSTVIGDIFVKFENDSIFRYLYIINNGDTLYSIKNNVFFNENNIVDVDGTIGKDIYGYTFLKTINDYILITYWDKNGGYKAFSPEIYWNYDDNIIVSFIP